MCKECDAKAERIRENFPELLMLEKAYEIAMSGDMPPEFGIVIDDFADSLCSQNVVNAITTAREGGLSPRAATEFFAEEMFKYGLAVGVACSAFYREKWAEVFPPSQEEAVAEFDRRKEVNQQRRENSEPGVAATPAMIEMLREMGLNIPEGIDLSDFRIVTSDDIMRTARRSHDEETGKEGDVPGMYL